MCWTKQVEVLPVKTTKNLLMEKGKLGSSVEGLFPDLVYTAPDGFKGVQYSRFVPILVEAINELSQELQGIKRDHAKLLYDKDLLSVKLSELQDE